VKVRVLKGYLVAFSLAYFRCDADLVESPLDVWMTQDHPNKPNIAFKTGLKKQF